MQKIEFKISPKKQLPEITESEKDKIMENAVNRHFEFFKENKDIDTPCEFVFDYLIEKGNIKNNKNNVGYYKKKLSEAKEILLKEFQNTKPESKQEVSLIKKTIESIKQNDSPKILIMAKKLVLIDYFTKCESEGKIKII